MSGNDIVKDDDDALDWDLEERDNWLAENDTGDNEDPTEIAVGEDE